MRIRVIRSNNDHHQGHSLTSRGNEKFQQKEVILRNQQLRPLYYGFPSSCVVSHSTINAMTSPAIPEVMQPLLTVQRILEVSILGLYRMARTHVRHLTNKKKVGQTE